MQPATPTSLRTVPSVTANSTLDARRSTLVEWAFRNSSDGILITDMEGKIQMVNDAFCSLFGYTREEVVGLRTGFLRSPHSTDAFYAEMWRSLRERGEWKGEIVNLCKDGRLISC